MKRVAHIVAHYRIWVYGFCRYTGKVLITCKETERETDDKEDYRRTGKAVWRIFRV